MNFEEIIMFLATIYLIVSLVVMVLMTVFILCVYYRIWKFKRKYKTPLAVLKNFDSNGTYKFIKTVLPLGVMLVSWWLKMHPDQKKK